jgi:hypothetical protein
MNLKSGKLLATLGTPLLGLLAVTTACSPVVASADGTSVTLAPGTAAASSAPAPAASSPQPVTVTPTATATFTPVPTPTPTATVTAQADVASCLPPDLSEADLNALATSAQARASLADCLQIPASDQGEFTTQLALYALEALQAGEFRTDAGRHAWTGSDGPVALPDGRTVYSLAEIYGRYSS